jgi:lipopolysaccharide biosynthesis glycosyltransferase
MQPHPTTNADREINIVSASDDGYAMPLAVTIRSILDHLAADRRLNLFVLDGGLSDTTKQRLLKSWRDPRLKVDWIPADMSLVGDLFISYQVNVVTYLRILMARLLPAHVHRAIYIDADTLVRRDLGQLWDEEQGPHAVLAVQDIAAPFIDAEASLPRFEECRQHLCAFTPIMNYRDLGLSPNAPYFNGGLLVVNIDQWRRERYAEQMLDVLRTHRQHILWWDQYALNVVLSGRWRAVDPRWNQNAHIYAFPSWRNSPLDRETYFELRRAPWIVHFCSPSKPWQYFCPHPFTRAFYRCLAHTDWRTWQPERPNRFWHKWWNFHYRPIQKKWKTNVRIAKQYIRGQKRRAA